MADRSKPPYRADHVGSLVRTAPLITAWDKRFRGEITEAQFNDIKKTAIREVVRMQEDLGLRSITDGEFNRFRWHTDFLVSFSNVVQSSSRISATFHSETGSTTGKPDMFQVSGKLARPQPIFVDDFRFLRSVTRQTPKITIPSPSIVHFRGGREAISEVAYPRMAEFYEDLARVYREEVTELAASGCRYLQIDDVNFAYLCDPAMRAKAQTQLGEDPDQLPHTYAKLINDSIRGRPADMTVCVHLCRGNFAGNWVAEGGYEPIAEILFNEINVDGYFMEYDSARAGGFEPLRYVPHGKSVVLGLVTTKKGAIESKDELKRRIDEAAKFIPLEQLCLSPQCGFSSGIGGNAMDIEDERRKLALVVQVAREVWGT